MEQLVARRAHNPEAVGSNPAPATTIKKASVLENACLSLAFCLSSSDIIHLRNCRYGITLTETELRSLKAIIDEEIKLLETEL